MKAQFIKEHGKLIEKMAIDNEPRWIYLKYTKGNFEKATYALKVNQEQTNKFIDKFVSDYHVSEEIKDEVKNFLTKEGKSDSNYQEFINFLLTTLSLHIMVGVALGLSIYGGYQLGANLDSKFDIYPVFTIMGVFCGVAIGSLVGYVMMLKYLGNHAEKGSVPGVKKAVKRKKRNSNYKWPEINVTLVKVREAVRQFADELPRGIDRTILVKDDFSLEFDKLAPYLGGIPAHSFYMSKETFEIFEEQEKDIPPIVDKVQKAVYLFYKDQKKYPIKIYDPLRRVNYYQLLQENYLDELPPIELYFTGFDGLITHQKPEKSLVGG